MLIRFVRMSIICFYTMEGEQAKSPDFAWAGCRPPTADIGITDSNPGYEGFLKSFVVITYTIS